MLLKIVPQTEFALRGPHGVDLVPETSHIWYCRGCRRAAGRIPPLLSRRERHTLVKKKGQLSVRCSPKAAPRSVTPRFSSMLLFTKRKPLFSDTWQRSRRETGWKIIVRRFRIFWDLSKSSEINRKYILIKIYGWHLVKKWSRSEVCQKKSNFGKFSEWVCL